jgi:3-methyladenine DNA glycosylase AlkD
MEGNVVKFVRNELALHGDDSVRESGKRFFKEETKSYGVKTSVVTKIAKSGFRELKGLDKNTILALCEELWKSGYMEESFIACHWAYALRETFIPDDFVVFEGWVEHYVSNWASCDTLCNHTVGAFVEMYPEYIENLKRWAKSEGRWMRRAAAVSLIIPARSGLFLEDIFEIADTLLLDQDDLVQKGYGWMLKAASQAHQREVYDYVMSKKAVMPRTSLRYAIEKMPKELRVKAMAKQ